MRDRELDLQNRELGAKLRSLRVAARLSGSELARRVGFSQPKISRIETGDLVPSERDVLRITAALEVRETVRRQLARKAKELRRDARSSHWFQHSATGWHRVEELELSSGCISSYDPAVLPASLQVPGYMEAMASLVPLSNGAERKQMVADRLQRQRRLRDSSVEKRFLICLESLEARSLWADRFIEQITALRPFLYDDSWNLGFLPPSLLPTRQVFVFDHAVTVVEMFSGALVIEDSHPAEMELDHFRALEDQAVYEREAEALLDEILEKHVVDLRQGAVLPSDPVR